MNRALALAFMSLMTPLTSYASISLLEKDDWKVQMSGFIEQDMFTDNRRSLQEVVGNSPVDRPGKPAGENGKTQFSIRNSRLAFSVLPPAQDEWKTKGYFEFDLMAPINATSDASFYTNAALRVRHAYLSAESNGWQFLAGQYWTLFGWNPIYVPTTASVPPGPGTIYQRTPQVTATKTIAFGEQSKVQAAASVARPSQADSEMPNLEIGAKYSFSGYGSAIASPTGDVSVQPLSVAVSATSRSFKTAATADGLSTSKTNGTGFAVDAMIPILASSDGKDAGNTLTLTGEFSTGKGFADAFPGWSGNLATQPSGNGFAGKTNLDAGQGGFDSSNGFHLVNLQSWNAQLQYHLPSSWHTFVTVGYAQLSVRDIKGLTPVKSGADALYDKSTMQYLNVFHDVTSQIRVAAEWAHFTTHYVDDVSANDDRYQVNAYFRF